MKQSSFRVALCGILIATAFSVVAQTPPAARAPGGAGTFGSGSKEPISVEADHLEVFDKEKRAVYSGNVVVVQGESTMKSGRMIVFYANDVQEAGKADGSNPPPAAQSAAPSLGNGNSLRRLETYEGTTIISKDQIAVGNQGVYDKESNRMILTGNVALTQNGNVTKGEKLVYDLTTGVAVVEAAPNSGRVKSLLIPNSNDDKNAPKSPASAPKSAPKS
jgi:lipopolysaccharide export system protein LptA